MGTDSALELPLQLSLTISCGLIVRSQVPLKRKFTKREMNVHGEQKTFNKLPRHTNGAHFFRTVSQRAQHLGRLQRAPFRFCILIRGPP